MTAFSTIIDTVHKAAQGDYSVRVEQLSDLELNPLSEAINELLEQVQKRYPEKADHNSERFLNTIIDLSPYPMWISDDQGTLIRANQSLRNLLKIQDEDVVGKYNILKDNIVIDQGFFPLVQEVYQKGSCANFLIRWDSHELHDPPLPNDTSTILDVTVSPVIDATGRVTNAIIQHIDLTERIHAEQALRKSEERLSLAQLAGGIGMYDWDIANNHVECNNLYFMMFGLTPVEIINFSFDEWLLHLHPDDLVQTREKIRLALEEKKPYDAEYRIFWPDNSVHWIHSKAIVFYDDNDKPSRMIGAITDITPRKEAEEEKSKMELQLLQAQKMESIGRLAGGVAHDFNNMLCVILGSAELLKLKISDGSTLLKNVTAIEDAAVHSRDIVRQLLAFSRKQMITPKPLNLNDLVTGTIKTLSRLIGEDINLRFYPENDLWYINFDSTQMDQILINMAVNARDAMPSGGNLIIETANIQIDKSYNRDYIESPPGQYIRLTISDTGTGIKQDDLSQIFEPFFTTKEVGKGTGLGLSTVYGIIKQNGGFINVYSEPNHGTSFKIHIPRFTDEVATLPIAETAEVLQDTGTILLVEDNDLVRLLTTDMLESIGYTVLATESPQKSLSLCTSCDQPIDLLITDVVMPEMNGIELCNKIKTILPEIKVLFMSGYSSHGIVHGGILEDGVHFLPKPFDLTTLAQKVRTAIAT